MVICVIAAVVVIGLLLPSSASVTRRTTIDAHPATVFALLNDFRQVNEWAPVTAGDPNARIEYSGTQKGVGARVSWRGQVVGDGSFTITASVPVERIVRESGSRRDIEVFEIEPTDDGSAIIAWTWRRDYGFNLAGRYFGLLQGGIRGPDIEQSLAGLARMAESLPRADFSNLEIEQIVVEATDIAYLTTRSRPDATAVSVAMNDSFFDILTFIDKYDLVEAGAPLSITRTFAGSELVFDAAVPIRGLTDRTPRTENQVKIGKTYEGPVIRVKHTGAYAELGKTHDKIAAWLAAQGIERNGDAWESYISDPSRTDESGLITYIYYPVSD